MATKRGMLLIASTALLLGTLLLSAWNLDNLVESFVGFVILYLKCV